MYNASIEKISPATSSLCSASKKQKSFFEKRCSGHRTGSTGLPDGIFSNKNTNAGTF
jgi:hypothetical protein